MLPEVMTISVEDLSRYERRARKYALIAERYHFNDTAKMLYAAAGFFYKQVIEIELEQLRKKRLDLALKDLNKDLSNGRERANSTSPNTPNP